MPLKVYARPKFIKNNLKLKEVQFVDSIGDADLVWDSQHFDEWEAVKPNALVNQCRDEETITYKQSLAGLLRHL